MRFLAATAMILSLATVAPLGAQRGSTGRIQTMTATSDATIPIRLFTVTGTNVRNHKSGLLVHGIHGRAAIVFQGGTLCVAPPIRRTPAVSSGGSPPPA